MKTIHNSFTSENYNNKDIDLTAGIFFDIETTGFSAKHTTLYLIGVCYYDIADNQYHSVQWFAENKTEEVMIIKNFFEFISGYKTLIHFNGNGFDIPYIIQKCNDLSLPYDFSGIESMDLYKVAKGLKNVLKLQNLKQKTIESFLGISREDLFSGGELIEIYEKYVKFPNDEALNLLILHNLDDLKGLTRLPLIFSYSDIFSGHFSINNISIDDKEAIIEGTLDNSIPSRISCFKDSYYMTAYKNVIKLRIGVYADELKYFYPNYKDYYYLPMEDRSIHKSVAFYVDKNYRTQAKAATCYSKKTGRFLPQMSEIVSPYFKIEYNDKITYFELTEDFTNDNEKIKAYFCHVLGILLT